MNLLCPEVDCDEVCGAGVKVDDDNLPAPENIPTPNEEVQSVTGDWGFNRQSYCRAAEHQNHTPNWEIAMGGVPSHCYSFLSNPSPLQF